MFGEDLLFFKALQGATLRETDSGDLSEQGPAIHPCYLKMYQG